jgi:hypothetical protein
VLADCSRRRDLSLLVNAGVLPAQVPLVGWPAPGRAATRQHSWSASQDALTGGGEPDGTRTGTALLPASGLIRSISCMYM